MPYMMKFVNNSNYLHMGNNHQYYIENRICHQFTSVAVLQTLVDAPAFTVSVGEDVVWDFAKHGASKIGTYAVDSDLVTDTRNDIVVTIPANTASGQMQIEVTYV